MRVARPRSTVVIVAQVSGQSCGHAPRTVRVSLSARIAVLTAGHVRGQAGIDFEKVCSAQSRGHAAERPL